MLWENNLRLTKLQVYINNIARCLDIVDNLSERRQDNQWNTLIQCDTIFTSQLSTNCNNLQQDSDPKTKVEKSTSPKNLSYSLCLPPKIQNPAPVITSLYLLHPPKFLHHHHNLCQKINLITHSNNIFLDMIKYLKNMIKY